MSGKQKNENAKLLDPDQGIQLRTHLESLRASMRSVRSSWDGQYSQLRAFFAPRNGRSSTSDVNRGQRMDYEIINECALLALRVLCSGMQTGMSNQTRVWFKTKPIDPKLKDDQDARKWCEEVDDIVRSTMLKSNFYQTLLEMYESEGLYGTGAFLIESDAKTDIRCHPYPIGSYYLGCDDTLRIDLCIRELSMTARQIVEKFGYENVSQSICNIYDSNAGGVKETYYPIAHVIHKGDYYGPSKTGKPNPPWMSIWYEIGQFNEKQGILRKSGFLENPLIAGRWRTVGENIYGESPAMDILGSAMSLQAWEERLAQAAEKQFNPPMIASSSIDPRRLTTLPGEFSFVDEKDVRGAFMPAYEIDFKLDGGLAMIQRIEKRIDEGMFRSLFQMISDSDRREITAEEIRARQQEKMQILGPVVERNVEEVLAPSYRRIVNILFRSGKLPPIPPAMQHPQGGTLPMSVEFESILASAQKMNGLNNINAVMDFAGKEAALNQGIMDNFDIDAVARRYGDLANLPSDLMRTPEQVQKIRADKARAAQQAELAKNAQSLAQAAQTASQTPTSSGNLLETVAPGLAGGSSG